MNARPTISADVFAKNLYEVFIQERSAEKCTGELRIPPPIRPRFLAKVEIYRKAVILMALTAAAEKQQGLGPVLRSYEALLFGAEPTPVELEKLSVLKAAMSDLASLIESGDRGRELNWSMAWFREIGNEEYNPFELALFAVSWMEEYIAVARAIKRCNQEFQVG